MPQLCPVCGLDDLISLGKRSDFYPAGQLRKDLAAYVGDVGLLVGKEIQKCLNCGFQFVSPPYGEREQAALYNFEGFRQFNDLVYPIQEFQSSEARALLNTWKEKYVSLGVLSWRKDFETAHKRRPRFLDVGCGRGQHLIVFNELGFDVSGVDISHMQIEWIKDRLDFDVKQGTVDNLDPHKSFDCILAAHVIEHVQCPTIFMTQLLNLLEPGGILIIETPIMWDWGSAEQRYRDVYHTLFFDHFTLVLLAARHGLTLQNTISVTHREDLRSDIYLLASLARDEDMTRDPIPGPMIRALRAAYDSSFKDFCVWGRYFIQHESGHDRSLCVRTWKFWRRYGLGATARASVEFLRRRLDRG